ncbi:hypothetical protein BIW11_07801 [Tropilaelaps mercedesae]|uniref:Uncharacterized protein n=1 Tax=Tropilaelaps mercedesae TaxID=418985 RepID=A0A1V9XSN5_9ACAR|nr:hypothetical protein BIW11_07801 [Tropilaelaps mercedesae]
MILSSSRIDSASNGHPNNNKKNNFHSVSSSFKGKNKTATLSLASVKRLPPKRRSPGFLLNLVHESKGALLAPFHPNRRKRSANFSNDSKTSRDKGTQTRPSDFAFSCPYSVFCGADGDSSTAIFSNTNSSRPNSTRCPQHAFPGQPGHNSQYGQQNQVHRMRRSSRARSGVNEWRAAATYHCPNAVLQRTSTLASSPIPKRQQQQQQIYSHNATSQNGLRSGLNGTQCIGSNPGTGRFSSIVCGSLATRHYQQIRDDIARDQSCFLQSRTLPARLEPSSLLSPDRPLTCSTVSTGFTTAAMLEANEHLNLTVNNNPPLSFRRLASSASSGGASPLFSACCCPNEMSHRFSSTSSCPSDQKEPHEEK